MYFLIYVLPKFVRRYFFYFFLFPQQTTNKINKTKSCFISTVIIIGATCPGVFVQSNTNMTLCVNDNEFPYLCAIEIISKAPTSQKCCVVKKRVQGLCLRYSSYSRQYLSENRTLRAIAMTITRPPSKRSYCNFFVCQCMKKISLKSFECKQTVTHTHTKKYGRDFQVAVKNLNSYRLPWAKTGRYPQTSSLSK